MKTLRKGDQRPEVRVLQERLTAAGYSIQSLSDYFGSQTDTALRNFQRKNKLLADGVVGANTWGALGVTDDAKPDVKPVNSLDRLVASLGFIGAYSAAVASNAPNTNVAAKPVSQLSTSEKGLQFIYTREAQKNVSNHLHWPRNASGATIGPGYDMKARSAADITRDMISIGVTMETAKNIAKAAGLRGVEAEKFCKTNRSLVTLPDKSEFNLLKIVVPYYERQARIKIKVDLLQYEFDALVSFAYNLGEVWTSLANHINNGKIGDAMTRMMAANKSGGEVNEGLTKRRALEVALYTFGNYGTLRVV